MGPPRRRAEGREGEETGRKYCTDPDHLVFCSEIFYGIALKYNEVRQGGFWYVM